MTDYRRWEMVIDGLQRLLLVIVILVIAAAILSLIMFDVFVGTGVMMYLTQNNLKISVFISLATTGLLMSLMTIGYLFISRAKGKTKNVSIGIGLGAFSFGLAIYALDVYFDSLTADFFRYGKIIVLNTITDKTNHILFRCLIGGISTVGESLALAIIMGMGILKDIIKNALPDLTPKKSPPNNNQAQERSRFAWKQKNRQEFEDKHAYRSGLRSHFPNAK